MKRLGLKIALKIGNEKEKERKKIAIQNSRISRLRILKLEKKKKIILKEETVKNSNIGNMK